MEQMNTYGPEFFFDGDAVGLFISTDAPRTPGHHRYEPYRGSGHYKMQSALRVGDTPRCYFDIHRTRIAFTVTDCPEYGVLALEQFEESSLDHA